MVRRAWAAALVLTTSVGCRLREVLAAPGGPPVLVVEGVLDTSDSSQAVLVEEAQAGETTVGVSGATVMLIDSTPRGCGAPQAQLLEVLSSTPRPSTYAVSHFCRLAAGDRVLLRVSTPDGPPCSTYAMF